MNALSRYDTARQALAEAKDLGEVIEIVDKAVAIKEYARRAKDRELELNAGELRIRAERKLGQMLVEIKETSGLNEGARGQLAGRDASGSSVAAPPEDQRPRLVELGIDKKLSARAQRLAVFDEGDFGDRVLQWRDRGAAAPKVTTDLLREAEQAGRRATHATKVYDGAKTEDLVALAASGFRAGAILADPPWHFTARSERGEGRSASTHYTTDAIEAIKALPIRQLAAEDCVLFMWMVDWCPKDALDVIEAWGFAHKTTAFTWAKQTKDGEGWAMGQGYWTRANPEDCWLATRGSPKRLNADVRQLVVAPIMEHSRKPDEIHDRIERLVAGPYLELYARRERPRWLTWGNEVAWRMPEALPETDSCGESRERQTSDTSPIDAMSDSKPEAPPMEQTPKGTIGNSGTNDDGLEIPAFLKRSKPEASDGC